MQLLLILLSLQAKNYFIHDTLIDLICYHYFISFSFHIISFLSPISFSVTLLQFSFVPLLFSSFLLSVLVIGFLFLPFSSAFPFTSIYLLLLFVFILLSWFVILFSFVPLSVSSPSISTLFYHCFRHHLKVDCIRWYKGQPKRSWQAKEKLLVCSPFN